MEVTFANHMTRLGLSTVHCPILEVAKEESPFPILFIQERETVTQYIICIQLYSLHIQTQFLILIES